MKKNVVDVMKDGTIELIVGIIAQYDEHTILPLLFTVDDIVMAYFKKKYGNVMTLEEIAELKASVHRVEDEIELRECDMEMYDSFVMEVRERKEKAEDDEIPFA